MSSLIIKHVWSVILYNKTLCLNLRGLHLSHILKSRSRKGSSKYSSFDNQMSVYASSKGPCMASDTSEVILDFLSFLEIQCNFRHCFLFPSCQALQRWNRMQCLKFHWISKQLKNSKTTSVGVCYVQVEEAEVLILFGCSVHVIYWKRPIVSNILMIKEIRQIGQFNRHNVALITIPRNYRFNFL